MKQHANNTSIFLVRPNVGAVYTPNLDSYLVPLIPVIKNPDQSLREMHDKICDIFRPLCILYDKMLPVVTSTEQGEEATFDHEATTDMMNCI